MCELATCPICNAKPCVTSVSGTPGAASRLRVECNEPTHWSGPECPTEDGARKAWNRVMGELEPREKIAVMPELSRCPICNSCPTLAVRNHKAMTTVRYQVECSTTKHTLLGPVRDTENDAADAWNVISLGPVQPRTVPSNAQDLEFKLGQSLIGVHMSEDESYLVGYAPKMGHAKVARIDLVMENGQMAEVPWAAVVDEHGHVRKLNLALAQSVLCDD